MPGLLGNWLDWPISFVANIFVFGLIALIVIQILIQFEIIPRHNQPARQMWAMLARIYDPLLRPLRQVLPTLGGFDLSPMILILAVTFISRILIGIL